MRLAFPSYYLEHVAPELTALEGYTNLQSVPILLKICINQGIGEASKNPQLLDVAHEQMGLICGQKSLRKRARQSVAGFKIRAGMSVGAAVTLRRARMYSFIEKLIHIVLPRIRDFKGVSVSGFDGRGNYNIGLQDKSVFPELPYEPTTGNYGLNISIVTSANSDSEGYALLRSFGMPFIEDTVRD